MRKVGIVAGGGKLPLMVIEACQKQGRLFHVFALKGQARPEDYSNKLPISWIRLGDVGKGFSIAKQEQCQDILLIGSVRRPSFSEIRPDWKGVKFLAKAGIKSLGDDGLLRAVIAEIEKEGFHVIGADSILSDCLAPLGIYGRIKPDKEAKKDIARGFEVAKALGHVDVGQSVIVADGIVLAVEAIEGTDALIARSKDLHRSGTRGVLVKVRKPKQERRADLPTIGTQTIENAAAAGLKGIAIEEGSTFVVDMKSVIELANRLGLFVVGVNASCLQEK